MPIDYSKYPDDWPEIRQDELKAVATIYRKVK